MRSCLVSFIIELFERLCLGLTTVFYLTIPLFLSFFIRWDWQLANINDWQQENNLQSSPVCPGYINDVTDNCLSSVVPFKQHESIELAPKI